MTKLYEYRDARNALNIAFTTYLSYQRSCGTTTQTTTIQVRKHADKALETLLAHDPGKETMIRELKFKTFNQEWLDYVDQNVDSTNIPPHSPMSPTPHEALMGLYDDEETAQVIHIIQSTNTPSTTRGN